MIRVFQRVEVLERGNFGLNIPSDREGHGKHGETLS